MPRIARTFIKTGLIFFLISLLLGIAIEIQSITSSVLVLLFWHTLMVGWVTQIIFGVSIWMFPGRKRDESVGAQIWGWLTYSFLNTGLILRIIAEPMLTYSIHPIWKVLVASSAVLQMAGGITYVIEMWSRVQSRKERLRKRKRN